MINIRELLLCWIMISLYQKGSLNTTNSDFISELTLVLYKRKVKFSRELVLFHELCLNNSAYHFPILERNCKLLSKPYRHETTITKWDLKQKSTPLLSATIKKQEVFVLGKVTNNEDGPIILSNCTTTCPITKQRKYIMRDEVKERLLENGRNLRKSKKHIICQVQTISIRKYSKEYIETVNRNRKIAEQKGELPPEVPLQLIHRHAEDLDFDSAIIPPGGISKKGYVNEAWIEYYIDSIQINNKSYDIINPYFHNTKSRIVLFEICDNKNQRSLLPSPNKLVVKYFKEKEI